ncbi:MAG: DNA replication/repair protein RecF [Micrococcaceae bacterium]
MYVEHLSLFQFRNYETAELQLKPGVNVLVGSNGMGKTNLVEALGYLAHLSSHRVSHDAVLVKHPKDQAIVRAKIARGSQSAFIEIELNAHKANRTRINKGSFSRQREILGMVSTVLFAPEDLAIVKGEPSIRRRFMDEMLVSIAPRFAGIRQDYDKALKQRNALIKSAKKARSEGLPVQRADFEVWNQHTAMAGAILVSARLQMLKKLEPYFQQSYAAFTDQAKEVKLNYSSSLENLDASMSVEEIQQKIVERMNERFIVEIERGQSVVGPQRDDIEIMLGELPAKGYASHGESWSVALALKLACYTLLKENNEEPILILDDVFAELDTQRRQRLAEHIKEAEQVIITAAVEDDIPQLLQGHKVYVSRGVLSEFKNEYGTIDPHDVTHLKTEVDKASNDTRK